MTDSALYATLDEMLAEGGRVIPLLKRMATEYIRWDEFLEMPLPSEMSPRATWDLLKRLNRVTGIELPIPDLDGNEYWYMRTHEIADLTSRIMCACRADSDLFRQLTATQNTPVLVRSRIDETVAAALLDGLDISPEDYSEMLRLDRTPRSDNERLVVNTLSALDHLGDLVSEPFSAELLMHLRDLVTDGVDPAQLVHTKSRMGVVNREWGDETVARHAPEQARRICDYANHLTGEPHDHSVFRALLLADLFRVYRPLPNVNSQVGRLVFRLYTLKMGIPVLGVLPLSRTKLQWEEGLLPSLGTRYSPAEYLADREEQETDLTGYASLSLRLTIAALEDLVWQLHDLERQDRELRGLLQRDPEINHRQRSILGRALRFPDAEFRIAYHKTTHNVVYATARADLLQLVDKGFLKLGMSGRAMVFTAREDLRDFIEHGYLSE